MHQYIRISITNFHVLCHRIIKVDPIMCVNFGLYVTYKRDTYILVGLNYLTTRMYAL